MLTAVSSGPTITEGLLASHVREIAIRSVGVSENNEEAHPLAAVELPPRFESNTDDGGGGGGGGGDGGGGGLSMTTGRFPLYLGIEVKKQLITLDEKLSSCIHPGRRKLRSRPLICSRECYFKMCLNKFPRKANMLPNSQAYSETT
ncbi:hypothetical protein HZH68_008337 [Vespula germanica]|uniref:Uncharacterized protein n=1 Tax=Vespula germanica TaxID=30212 RepID=A0A834K4J8_VESGE|nr:hypothetical protein HZH68_008337 [Vespula germanica]